MRTWIAGLSISTLPAVVIVAALLALIWLLGGRFTKDRLSSGVKMVTRGEVQGAIHLRAVQDIAEARFGFPTDNYPHFKAYINHPEKTMGVRLPDGRPAYPDIVVVEDPENYTEIIGEVETAETVTEEEAAREWLPFAELGPLYLFVPTGMGDEAMRIVKKLKVPIVGLRTWRYAVGYDEIEITKLFDQPSGPEDLLPEPLKGIAKQFL